MAGSDKLKIYLINLDRAQKRRAFMEDQLDRLGLEHERFAAIDGEQLEPPYPHYDAAGYARWHGRTDHPREIACYLSHHGCLQRFLATGAEHALILEDDCLLPPDLADILDAAITQKDDWDLLRLSTVNSGIRVGFAPLTASTRLAIALTREKGAGAYVVSRKCAGVFAEKLLPIRLAWDIAFDLEFLHGLKACFVEPPPVDQQTRMQTQIQISLSHHKLPATRYLTVFPFRARVETWRFVARGYRLVCEKLRRWRADG